VNVFIANFGRENLFWDLCRRNSTVAAYEDEDTWPFWDAGDRAGYIEFCMTNKRSARGIVPPKPTASRWFNLPTIVSKTEGDLWLHREKEELWWSMSRDGSVHISREAAPWAKPNTSHVYLLQKPATEWRGTDLHGTKLLWKSIHPKAREFLFTEGTIQKLSPDHADYARALVDGDSLAQWHGRPDWKRRADASGHGAVKSLDARQRAVVRMVTTAEYTVKASNAPPTLQAPKRKRSQFTNPLEFRSYVDALIELQDGRCAITEIPLQFDGEEDDIELTCSLDRIDSSGDYAPKNLQVVCKFVNRWKSAEADESFRRLISIVRGSVNDS
jgi:hypothetical protein